MHVKMATFGKPDFLKKINSNIPYDFGNES